MMQLPQLPAKMIQPMPSQLITIQSQRNLANYTLLSTPLKHLDAISSPVVVNCKRKIKFN